MGKIGITYNDLDYFSIQELVKMSDSKDKEFKLLWEQSRMISYWSFKGHAKKTFKPKDVVTFPWEKNEKLTKGQITKIRANASKLRELIKDGKVKFSA